MRRPLRFLVVFAALIGGVYYGFTQLPSSFIPEEDQGVLMTIVTLPDRANAARTQAVIDIVEDYYLTEEKDSVESVFTTVGFSLGGSGENSAMAFVKLRDFAERKTEAQSASAVAGRATMYFSKVRDAQIFALSPPAIQGLGSSNGFEMVLLDNANNGTEALGRASNDLADLAGQTSEVTSVRGNAGELETQLKLVIDQEKAGALGVDLSGANSLLSVALAGTTVNDFDLDGELKPVIVKGDSEFRMQPDDLKN